MTVDSSRASNASANSYASRVLTSLRYDLRSSTQNADRRERRRRLDLTFLLQVSVQFAICFLPIGLLDFALLRPPTVNPGFALAIA